MRRGSKKNRFIDTWLGIPVLNMLAVLRRHRKYPDRVERVGVMCSLALGDTLLVSAAVRSVRSHFPTRHLVFFCGPQNIAAAKLLSGVDELVLIDLLKPRETIRRMREQRLDLLLDFSAWQRLTAFYSMMSGARFTAGFRTAGQHRHRGYDLTTEHSRERHEVDNFRSLLRSIGITECYLPRIVPPAIPPPELVLRRKQIIVFHLWPSGVCSYTREWPEDCWVALAKHLATLPGEAKVLFVITGAPSDQARSEPFVQKLREVGLEAESFVGQDGFASLCQVLLHARLVVSVNTGVMHLAAILGAPTISLNGPTNNGRWGPVGPRAMGVQSPGEGCGYLHLGFESSDGPMDCMERITVDMVLAAANVVLGTPHTLRSDNSNQDGVALHGAPSAVK
jgi:heptosyltransferase III